MIEAINNEEFGRKLNEIENDWIDEVRDRELGYLYRVHGRETYSGTSEQVLRRIETYMKYGASCFMLKFGDHPKEKTMMRLFKTGVIDQVKRA